MRATTASLPRFCPIISLIGVDLSNWVCTVFSFALQLHDGTRLASHDCGIKKKLSSLRLFYIARLLHGRCRSHSRTQDGSDPRAVGPGCSLFRVLRKEEFVIVSAWYVIRFITKKIAVRSKVAKAPIVPHMQTDWPVFDVSQ